MFGEDAYPDLTAKIGALVEGVVRNNALVGGNERAGWALAVVTIWLKDHELVYDGDEAFAMVMRVAEGRSSLTEITEWFASRIRLTSGE